MRLTKRTRTVILFCALFTDSFDPITYQKRINKMNISAKEKTEPQLKAEAALLAKGHNVTVLWDGVFLTKIGRGSSSRVDTVCGHCGTVDSRQVYTLGKGHYCCDYCRVNKIQPKKAVVSPVTILKSETVLAKNTKLSVEIDWGNVFYRNNKQCVNVKCNHCETTSERYVGGIVKGFNCEQCTVSATILALEKINRTYIDSELGKVKSYCNVCDAVTVSSSSDVRRGLIPKCNTCLENKYSEMADAYGFDFVSKQTAQHKGNGTKNTFITLKCRKDHTLTDVTVGALKTGYFECKECVLQGYRDSLSIKGCELINTFHADDYAGRSILRVEYKNQAGEIFTARSSILKTGKFATTLDNHWAASHSTYLIKTVFKGSTYYKIGTANVPSKRLKILKLLGESKVFTLESFPDRFGADKLESELQTEFLQFKLDPEIAKLFTGNKLHRKRVGQTERVYVKDGIHEWYKSEVYDILKDRYKLE